MGLISKVLNKIDNAILFYENSLKIKKKLFYDEEGIFFK